MNTNNEEGGNTEKVPDNRSKYLWIVLISLGSLIYAACYVFPPTVKIQNQLLTECPTEIYKDLGYSCGQYDTDGNPTFALKMDEVQDSDQFIHLNMAPYLSPQANNHNNKEGEISRTFPFKIEKSVYAISTRNHPLQKIHQEKKEFHFICTNENAHCIPQIIDKISDIKHSGYIFIFKIFNTMELQERHVEDIKLSLVSLNGLFQKYMSAFKWVLFIISIISFILYKGILSSLPKGFATDEQKIVGLLALSLILFTEPIIKFFEHKYLYYKMIHVIGVAIPNSLILMLWLYLIERLASSSTDVTSKKCKDLIKFIALIHFMVLSFVYGSLASDQVNNMLLDFEHSTNPHIMQSSYYFTGFSIFIVVWSVVRVLMILPKLNGLSWRDGTSLTFTFCFIVCSLFFTWTHSFQVLNLKSTRIILLYGMTVLYSILLQVIYTPLSSEIEEAEKKRKYENPETKAQYGDLDDSDVETPSGIVNAHELQDRTVELEGN